MNKYFSILLFCMLPMVHAHAEGKVSWNKNIYLEYIDGEAENQSELLSLVNMDWNEEVIVRYKDLGIKRIKNCSELIEHEVVDVEPSVPRDYYLVQALKTDCYALLETSSLKEYSSFFLSANFDSIVDELIQLHLPAEATSISNIFEDAQNLHIKKCEKNSCTIEGNWGESIYVFNLKSYGDYNGDHIGDMVVSISKGSSTGDPATLNFVLTLTKLGKNSKITILNMFPAM